MLVGLLAGILMTTGAVAEPPPRAVLIIGESDPSVGVPTIFSTTLRATLAGDTRPVAVYSETLDFSHFSRSEQEAILRTYLKEKYGDVQFGAIAAVGLSAFELVRHLRSELWPGVPVVFGAIDEISAAELKLDSDVTGVAMRRTIKSMMVVARSLVPDLKGVAVLGGSVQRDPYRRQYLREFPQLAAEIEVTNLTGLPLAEQAVRAATLPDYTAILYTSLFIDDSGARYSSPDALAAIARSANRPIVIDVESLIGLGATGGFVLNNVSYGREVASLVLRILDGASAATIPVAVSEFTQPIFDWRQLNRWQIRESALPTGSEIRFRPPTAWEQYHWQIVLIATAFLAQTSLIVRLFYEHRRRRRAEVEARRRLIALAHMNRSAAVGEMSASIAHEINQPLAAIVTSGNAGLRWLANKTPNLEEAAAAFKRIVSDGHRAGEVIATVRAMFKRDYQGRALVDVTEIIREVLGLLRFEVEEHQVSVRNVFMEQLPSVLADRIQLQQVILNLVRNAMEAMSSVAERARILHMRVEANESDVVITIQDSGPGIDPKNLERIFEPFFTTKSKGMGMGLSICRSIIEAHGGRLVAAPRKSDGAVFEITLPRRRAVDSQGSA
jgi:signal transduction histidine kinase